MLSNGSHVGFFQKPLKHNKIRLKVNNTNKENLNDLKMLTLPQESCYF